MEFNSGFKGLNINMNKHLKFRNVQNIHKTEMWNEGCDNIYIY